MEWSNIIVLSLKSLCPTFIGVPISFSIELHHCLLLCFLFLLMLLLLLFRKKWHLD